MSTDPDLPEAVEEAVKLIRELRKKPHLTREDRENVNRAKLRIAYWACRNESVSATRQNLSYVLGRDAEAIMKAYDKYLENESQRKDEDPARKRQPDKTRFWGGV